MMNSGDSNNQEVEINLAPIIDCFTVLVTFLLATSTFLSIGALDAGVAAGGAAATQDASKNEVQITMQLEFNSNIKIITSGAKRNERKIASIKNDKQENIIDIENLKKTLADIKKSIPETKFVILSADEKTEYKGIVQTLDAARTVYTDVMLGGF